MKGAEEAEEEKETVRGMGYVRVGVKDVEWMDESGEGGGVERKMERMQTAIDKLSGERREM